MRKSNLRCTRDCMLTFGRHTYFPILILIRSQGASKVPCRHVPKRMQVMVTEWLLQAQMKRQTAFEWLLVEKHMEDE